MAPRIQLQQKLKEILGSDNVYFQPPANVQMQYPCIIYHRDYASTEFAGNEPYKTVKRYMVTVVDQDPDSAIPDRLALLPMCTFNRFYTADNLNHDVYNLFF
jgi:hypothetical protein